MNYALTTDAYIARKFYRDGKWEKQQLWQHLINVANLCEGNAKVLGIPHLGYLIGLYHDAGKYADEVQQHLNFMDKQRPVHSLLGAQLLYMVLCECEDLDEEKKKFAPLWTWTKQICCLSILSHHVQIRNCDDDYIEKSLDINNYSPSPLSKDIAELLHPSVGDMLAVIQEVHQALYSIWKGLCSLALYEDNGEKRDFNCVVYLFASYEAIFIRMIYSCLVNADRNDSAAASDKSVKEIYEYEKGCGEKLFWEHMYEKLQKRLEEIKTDSNANSNINIQREIISRTCETTASVEKHIFKLSVPTGSGKTMATMRFATKRASKYKDIKHIIYVAPFTSIIDQTFKEMRGMFCSKDGSFPIVTEDHSCVCLKTSGTDKNKDNEINDLLADSWDTPFICTTVESILHAAFKANGNNLRKFHNMVNSIIIFDEIQAMPIDVLHQFCMLVNYLTKICGCDIIICTATQPQFKKMEPKYGSITAADIYDMVPSDKFDLNVFKRAEIQLSSTTIDDINEIGDLIVQKEKENGSCVMVCNTTKAAAKIFFNIEGRKLSNVKLYHLSAKMSPAHRDKVINQIKEALKNNSKVICVSTQVLEAGIDIDFASAIRSLAGLDSIIQTNGRNNRNGTRSCATTLVVKLGPNIENAGAITEVRLGQNVLKELGQNIPCGNTQILKTDDKDIASYFNLFYKQIGMNNKGDGFLWIRNGFDLLKETLGKDGIAKDCLKLKFGILTQPFETVGSRFSVIESDTVRVVVPDSEEGRALCNEIATMPHCQNYKAIKEVIKRSSIHSVSIRPNELDKMVNVSQSVTDYCFTTMSDSEIHIYVLTSDGYYNSEVGLLTKNFNEHAENNSCPPIIQS